MTDPRPREQMTPPEELASIYEKYSRRYDDEVVVALRRLAALEREKEVLENAWAGLSAENARLREALHVIRITGPEREAGLARQALAGVPDAPDAQEPLPTTYPADASDFPDWQEREVRRIVAQRCAPLVEALEQCCRVSDHAGRIARKALAAHRAQEKAGGAEADRGE